MATGETLAHMAIRVPPFIASNVNAWFSILEGQFALGKISVEETKYYHALCSLPPELISKLPQETLSVKSYDILKAEVISRSEESKPELFEKLIAEQPVTGRPSDQMHELIRIASRLGINDDLIRHKFLQSIDKRISPILAAQTSVPLTNLGKLADDMMPFVENRQFQANVLNVNRSDQYISRSRPRNDVSEHSNQLRDNTIRPFSPGQRPKICRSHIYFAEKAKFCKPWCRYPNKPSSITIQQSSRPNSPIRQEKPLN